MLLTAGINEINKTGTVYKHIHPSLKSSSPVIGGT